MDVAAVVDPPRPMHVSSGGCRGSFPSEATADAVQNAFHKGVYSARSSEFTCVRLQLLQEL